MSTQNEALALKYRPINFEELVGQESVSKTLSLALESKRLSHAYLFSGLRGSGKTSSARIFARALMCDEGPKAKPCGVCANCVAANPHKMRHIDIIELDAASSRSIDDIRDLIEQTKYHPNMGRFKIFIIDEVHMLTKEAFNALLKTLEEPPEYVKFILATTDPLKVPATILSRTQHFRFKRISDKSIFSHLKKILEIEKVSHQDEALWMLIRSGSGSLRDTLTLLDQAIIYTNYNITAEFCANMLGLINPQSIEKLFDLVFVGDKKALLEEVESFFEYESEMLLDEIAIYLKEKLISQSDSRFKIILVDRFFRIIAEAKNLLLSGVNDNFILTLVFFKMLEALKIEEIDKVIENLEKGLYENLPHIKQVETLKETQKVEIKEAPKEEKIENPLKNSSKAKDLFSLLQEKISDRSYELGECFSKNITFLSFENDILSWESSAQGEDKTRLANAYSIIKTFVYEIYGINTQIKNITKIIPKSEIEATKEKMENTQESLENPNKQEAQKSIQEEKSTDTQESFLAQDYQKQREEEVHNAMNTPLFEAIKKSFDIKSINVREIQNGN